MATNHRTARGISVDMDRIRLANETAIAVGNMKVNARGDQLGNGGKIVKTRQQIMAEKNKLHKSPIADDFSGIAESMDTAVEEMQENVVINIPDPQTVTPTAEDTPVVESTDATSGYVKPRGSFADAVAKETEVTQELLDPSILPGSKPIGIQRI
jgi:hypothetical protein